MKQLFILVASMLLSSNILAGEAQYNLRIDGITCPFCVATSAKALKKIDGVKSVGSDLEKGLIKVCASETVVFTDEQLTKLFIEKGFSYRGKERQEKCDPA